VSRLEGKPFTGMPMRREPVMQLLLELVRVLAFNPSHQLERIGIPSLKVALALPDVFGDTNLDERRTWSFLRDEIDRHLTQLSYLLRQLIAAETMALNALESALCGSI
jgi:hypothetical protein